MKPERLIVRCPNWIGDQILALDFYRNLRDHYPNAHITWALKGTLKTLAFEGLADEVLVLPLDKKALKEKKFDLSISLPATLRAAYPFFCAQIPNRVGFRADGNEIFYTSSIPWKGRASKKHKSELYLELFEFLTGKKAKRYKSIEVAPAREKKIVLAPGASISLREWPYFEGLLTELKRKFPDYSLTFVGSHESRRWHEVLKNHPHVEDLIEKTDLKTLTDICKSASLVIANDSGTAHLAATLGNTKTVVLFGPGDPHYIEPRGVTYALQVELPCVPCEKPYCRAPFGYQACLKNLSVSEVLEAVEKAL